MLSMNTDTIAILLVGVFFIGFLMYVHYGGQIEKEQAKEESIKKE